MLVVDDDADLRTVLRGVFERVGFVVHDARDGEEALAVLHRRPCSLVVLDIGLPGEDGVTVLRQIRERSDVPVVMLTARASEASKVSGLMMGADDYVTKPFSARELVARSLAVLRRASATAAAPLPDRLADGRVVVDLAARIAEVDGRPVHLSPIDWRLLVTFLRHRDVVLTPGRLMAEVWQDPVGVGPDRVKFAVLRLRKRLGWDDVGASPIQSVRGLGYVYRSATLGPGAVTRDAAAVGVDEPS